MKILLKQNKMPDTTTNTLIGIKINGLGIYDNKREVGKYQFNLFIK